MTLLVEVSSATSQAEDNWKSTSLFTDLLSILLRNIKTLWVLNQNFHLSGVLAGCRLPTNGVTNKQLKMLLATTLTTRCPLIQSSLISRTWKTTLISPLINRSSHLYLSSSVSFMQTNSRLFQSLMLEYLLKTSITSIMQWEIRMISL